MTRRVYLTGFGNAASFCLKTALFLYGVVNLRACLCDVKYYVSAQILDFLAIAKNCSFSGQKLVDGRSVVGFCLKTALFLYGVVNLRVCLCDVKYYVSAQTFDFLAIAKNSWFSGQKLAFQ